MPEQLITRAELLTLIADEIHHFAPFASEQLRDLAEDLDTLAVGLLLYHDGLGTAADLSAAAICALTPVDIGEDEGDCPP